MRPLSGKLITSSQARCAIQLPTNTECVLVQMTAHTHREDAVYRRMRRHSFGPIGLAQITSVAQTVQARLDEVPAAAAESAQLQLVQSGSLILQQGDAQTRFNPGELAVYDASRPFSFIYPKEFRTTIIQVPSVLLTRSGVLAESLNARSIPAQSTGRLMLEGVLRGSASSPSASDRTALSGAIIRAARLAISELDHHDESREEASRGLADKAVEYVTLHYTDSGLTAALVAEHFHVSLRTLFAAFEDRDESLATIVRRIRLAAAERLLSATRLPITDVAQQVGYADVTAFIRAWRAATGSTPARWRRTRTLWSDNPDL